MEELAVGKIIISKQIENSDNYQRFLRIIKEKNIEVNIVKKGEKILFDKDVYMDVLWPKEKTNISENVLNNNAMVLKLHYFDFSMLFTGDIEKKAEDEILEQYRKTNCLKSIVLKVAHHGSKTSSTNEFLYKVSPKVSVIGVGQNNKFGHPSENTLENLKLINCEVYRTDRDGEITIIVNKNRMSIDKCIK